MVELLVGKDKSRYLVHKNVIRKYSEYFDRAFGLNYQEGENGTMYLAEVDKATFEIIHKWLYMKMTQCSFSSFEDLQERLSACKERLVPF
jgi:hypothetical protein